MTIGRGDTILPEDVINLAANAAANAADGTVGQPGLAFAADRTAGLYRRKDGGIGMVRNGIEGLTLSTAGIIDGRVVGPTGDTIAMSLIAAGILPTPQMFGVKGDGVTDDTANLQKAIASGFNLWFPPATYLVSSTLMVTKAGQMLSGAGQNANIKFLPGAAVQPIMIVAQSAANARISALGFDHQGSLFPAPTVFAPGLLGGGGGDARGNALLVMADGAQVDHVYVDNAWDNGIGFGNFDLTTGAEAAGPDHVKASNCSTYNCGTGKHGWGYAPLGYYNQGAGIDMLTATNFVVANCTDYASYNSFWCDTLGGGRGLFVNCTSIDCQQGSIWSDAAQGGNQPWYMSGFGTSITFAGSGWMKTPGGVAFYSGSYDVQFLNCTAINPAWIGFGFDSNSSGNLATNCRVVGAQGPGIVDSGLKNSFNGIKLRGCATASGLKAPSGSICPVIGAFEAIGQAGGPVKPQVTDLTIDGSPAYPGQASTLSYPYAIYARADRASGAASALTVIGATVTPGVDAVAGGNDGVGLWDPGCSITIISGTGGQMTIASYGQTAGINLASNGIPSLQVGQDAAGDVTINAVVAGKTLTLSAGGTPQLVVSPTGIAMPKLSTAIPAAGSGQIYKNSSGAMLVA